MRGSCGRLQGDLSNLVAEGNLSLTCVRTSFFYSEDLRTSFFLCTVTYV